MTGIIGLKIRDNYQVEAEIGKGGMGIVYRARDLGSGETVAIKVIAPKALADPERLRRFRNEAKVTSSINHPGIVTVREVGSEEIAGQQRDFIVMELVTGSTLSERINGRPLPLAEALGYGIQIVAALAAAHAAGITHRDVKPSNVIINSSGVVKLVDFGLAKFTERPADPFAETGSVQLDLTQDGTIIGSVAYMSPEQARGLPVDPRSDIFSFGAVFYEMLSGRPAFDGATTADKLSAVLTKDPDEIPNVPFDLVAVLMRCLRKEVGRRWQSALELKSALEDIRLAGATSSSTIVLGRTSSRRAWMAAAGGFGAGLLPAAYLAFRQTESPVYQRLTFRAGDITGARFAPGGLVAFTAAWDGRPPSLYTCQPGNREPRPLGLPRTTLAGVTSSSQAALLYPDESTLSVVSLGGGEPRPRLTGVISACWGPDGESFAVVKVPTAAQAFSVEYPVGVKRHESPQRPPMHLCVSPSGADLAFFEFVPEAADHQLVVLYDKEKPKVLSRGWRATGGLFWTPSGRELWFTGARANQDPSVYAISLKGKERTVTQTPEWLYLHDVHADGRVLAAPTQSRLTIRIGGPGREEQSHSWLDSSAAYDISADDRYLLFAELAYAAGRNPYIYIRDLDGSPARLVGEGNRPALSPDGRSIVCTRAVGADYHIAILPNGPGQEATRRIPGWSFEAADWLPDSARLLAYARHNQDPFATYLVDAAGNPGPMITPPRVRAIKASPDGRFCAGIDQGQIRIYPTQPGLTDKPRDVATAFPGESVVRWTSRGIFCRSRAAATRTQVDLIDPAAGGRRTRAFDLALPEAGAGFLEPTVISPSGRVYAFTYQRDIASLYMATGLH